MTGLQIWVANLFTGVKSNKEKNLNLNFGVQRHFLQYFSYIMAISFSGGGSRSTRREPPTLGKQLVNYHLRLRVECTLFCNLQSWARTHAVLVIDLYELLDPTT
jgi:hypothetical protein